MGQNVWTEELLKYTPAPVMRPRLCIWAVSMLGVQALRLHPQIDLYEGEANFRSLDQLRSGCRQSE